MMSGPTVHSYEKQSSRGRLLESSGTKSMMSGPIVHEKETKKILKMKFTRLNYNIYASMFYYALQV